MRTPNKCFHGEIRKYQHYFAEKKKSIFSSAMYCFQAPDNMYLLISSAGKFLILQGMEAAPYLFILQ